MGAEFNIGSIPAALRERDQWVCWRYEEKNGKRTKVPINPRTGRRASVTTPSDWTSFDKAVAGSNVQDCDGVGFVFTADDPFCGIDLDGCIDEAGMIVPAAREIVDSFNSYTEVSPSGRGVKMFIRASKPEGSGCRSKAIAGFKETEVYDRDRFFTVTGRRLPGTHLEVAARQAELEGLSARLWRTAKPARLSPATGGAGFEGDDEQLVGLAKNAMNGAGFAALWAGDASRHGDDRSAADLALCNHLAFWTGRDAERMDRLFRVSGLYRDKWDAKRGETTYGRFTIAKAIEGCTEAYASGRPRASACPAPVPTTGNDRGDDALPAPLGFRDPVSGRMVLCPKRTVPTGDAYLNGFHAHADGWTLRHYAGQFRAWKDNRYRRVEDGTLMKEILPWLHGSVMPKYNSRKRSYELVPFESNPKTAGQVLDTVRAAAHLPESTVWPSWLDGGDGRDPASEILCCRSLNLHLPSMRILPPTPALFTLMSLDVDFDPRAPSPTRWFEFLRELFGDDQESIDLLQDWMGYCLTRDTRQQKMLLIVGPPRSGKGTIARVMRALLGEGNVAAPTTSSLTGNFGVQPLIDKPLAIISDARFGGKDVMTSIERLLCVTGEDAMTVDRKYLDQVSLKLPTRFMILTNEPPSLSDASTAIVKRFMVLKLKRSFFGKEDEHLSERLMVELPGILRWAIQGWQRLAERGRFVQPRSGEDLIHSMEELASPISAFIRECCVLGPRLRVPTEDLFNAWQQWCAQRSCPSGNLAAFGKLLSAARADVQRRRGTDMSPFYEGIALRNEPT
ncbi:MAG: hypothetical protein K2Q20_07170 [Phycisphaerales bacterium]|nr:hypothetical protein [Phycisphaerales bacterium]